MILDIDTRKDNVRILVFSILSKEYPLKIIELTNYIRKRYGKAVTFQAVRKALLQLVEEGILIEKENKYSINKEWVKKSRKYLDSLYEDITKTKITPTKVDSIRGEINVFTFDSINNLMKFWQDIIDNWFENFKKGDPNINCYQGAHAWEGLLHLDREKHMMGRLKKKGIKSYILSTGNTPLDKSIWKFYKEIGLKTKINPSSSAFDRSYYMGTYGETIVQVKFPQEIVEDMDKFFKKNKSIYKINLNELSEIANKKVKVKMTVIKNLEMAKQINKSILSEMD